MTCSEAQEIILGLIDDPGGTEVNGALAQHLALCPECREFAEEQQRLDARLAAAVPVPRLSPEFRSALRERLQREPGREWAYWLPDALHFGASGIALLICLILLPFPIHRTLSVGGALVVAAWALELLILSWMESQEMPGR